jgi:TatD DNase family protein
VCGTCEADWEAVVAYAASEELVIPMLGLHPWFVGEASLGWVPRLGSLLRSQPAGLGECGLDFSRQDTERASQEAAFRVQLRLAHTLRRPAALHVVRAWGRLVDLLKEEGVPPAGTMVHAYAGSCETARTLQAMGLFLSFSGDILRPDRVYLQDCLRSMDAAKLLLETDGNSSLMQVLEKAAEIRGITAESLADQTWENGRKCFKELLA